ncbi:hypothetical protein LTS09_008134 [Friedmanniomyces endolithicus]|nr:hypothetical protein LTS09_008134 [Friedmanniomyces endolithicus]
MSTLSISPMRHSTLSSEIAKAHGPSTEAMREILQGYEVALRIAKQLDEEYDDLTEDIDARRELMEAEYELRTAESREREADLEESREEGDVRRE